MTTHALSDTAVLTGRSPSRRSSRALIRTGCPSALKSSAFMT